MKKTEMEDLIELFGRITEVASSKDCESVTYDYNGGKHYYAINFRFRSGNSKYEDCLVLYCDGDDFDKDELLSNLNQIVNKAKSLCV